MIRALKELLPAGLRIRLGRLRRRIVPYPYVVELDRVVASGCRFAISNEWERGRVESLGGEPEFLREFLSGVGPRDTVFDVGACVGLYALHAALLGARAVAFEPDPAYRRRLVKNVRLNRLRRSVRIVPWAVSDRSGTVMLYSDGLVGRSPTLERVPGRRGIPVATDSVDRAVAAGALPRPDVIKLDIEGAEILALRGMRETLARPDGPRALFIELHPLFLPGFGSSAEECRAILADLGYVARSEAHRADQVHCVYVKGEQG